MCKFGRCSFSPIMASIVGQIISMGLAIGSITRLRTIYMYELINSCISWRMSFTFLKM
jgi:hypothetical protein